MSQQVEAGPSNEGKKRPKQPQLSCAECRRLKLKCNREVPCSNCFRRKCSELCPDGVKETRRQTFDVKAAEQLQKRLSTLESLLADNGVEVPSPETDIHSPAISQTHNKRRRESSFSVDRSHPLPDLSRVGPSSPPYRSPIEGRRTPISSAREYALPTNRQSEPGPSSRHAPMFWGRETSDYRLPASSSPQQSMHMHSGVTDPLDGGITLPRSPVGHSHGTLVLGQEGRSRYLGPTAGTEWLKNQELGDAHSPEIPASQSPEYQPHREDLLDKEKRNATEHLLAFPFPLPTGPSTMESLLSHLPPKEDAEVLMDSYYRYFAWNHDTAPRSFFQPVFDRIFQCVSTKSFRSVHPQQLALLYAILAMGTLQNLELPPNDPTADEYLALAKGSLTKGDFLNNNTIAGVQTLIIMAHYLLETEKGRNGDSAWPLWGLAMRIIVAMGLHRDGARWNLPADVVEERRQVFWAAYAIEILQANCFSRPTSLAPQYIDTAFPVGPDDHPQGSKSYQTLRFELIQLSAKILDTGMSVHFESYDTILSLYTQLCSFERSIPYELRCKTALLSTPSEYPDTEIAKQLAPEVTRRSIKKTFQQFTLALNISEHVLFMHRPYFVMAMHDQPIDPTRSVYGRSYLAVVERCSVMIQVVATLYYVHPAVSSRQWFLWYHIFTAAVCLGTMVLRNPTSVLAQFALTSIDQSISVYSSLIKQNNSPSMVQNHDWLIRLRSRAFTKIISSNQKQNQEWETGSGRSQLGSLNNDTGVEEDMDIVGWRTRLIESASNGSQIAINIPSSSGAAGPTSSSNINKQLNPTNALFTPPPTSTQPNVGVVPAVQQVLQQHLVGTEGVTNRSHGTASASGGGNGNNGMDASTDLMLHQFWDPMMMPDAGNLASANWWSWDMGLNNEQASTTHTI
ncbi:uncharacterized protein IL334_002198 [Kwoniella shivajii]|uniref:Zn(2)-C6 fungal-type domain-containing protein n=1 Tax=Kwoniella shivajii TaxID=564305 RepID=A0ABZ1CVN0_9TREE|nr:hypothetical protein IL334_002198 [Kwoniella shivajii]